MQNSTELHSAYGGRSSSDYKLPVQLLKTEDGSYTLFDPEQQEAYHSKFGALTESDQVYLRNSGVYERLASQQPTSILEIGFGTGFNFVHTASHARKHNCPLCYTAYEFRPLDKRLVLEVLINNAPQETQLCKFTADAIDRITVPDTRASLSIDHQTELHLHHADVATQQWPAASFDAIYLDAFSKKNNPALWCTDFLDNLYTAARPHALLATYCVNGEFRASLAAAGFDFKKLPGPRGKREVLIASPA